MRQLISTFLLPAFLLSCGDKEDSGPDGTPAALAWYSTCGDPACEGYAGPTEGVGLCSEGGQSEGDTCEDAGNSCDLEDDCNRRLLCAGEDPAAAPGGCPVSVKSTKTDIAYLGPEDLSAARDALLGVRLAQWRYTWDPPQTQRLGFLIDDGPASVAVQPDGQHVDVYGYASLAVAAAQAQQVELDRQAARLAAQEAELAALRAEMAALRKTLTVQH